MTDWPAYVLTALFSLALGFVGGCILGYARGEKDGYLLGYDFRKDHEKPRDLNFPVFRN